MTMGEGLVLGCRDLVTDQELLGEILGAFELGGQPGRPEDRQAGGAEGIDDARGERGLGPDDGEADLFLADELDELGDRGDGHVGKVGFARRAGVAGGDENLMDPRRAGQLPGQRVFASAGADDEDLHGEHGISDGSGGSR